MTHSGVYALVLAAGGGTRFRESHPGRDLPASKALAELAGKPILAYSIRQFDNFLPLTQGCVVSPPEMVAAIRSFTPGDWQFVTGGKERQDSVLAGLNHLAAKHNLGDDDIVFVHDGVRPFFRLEELEALRSAARKTGCATLSRPVTDTTVDVSQLKYLVRKDLRSIQTPQCLRGDVAKGIIKLITEKGNESQFTDETSMATFLGYTPAYIDGNRYNRKLTYFEDLPEFEAIARHFFR